MMKQFVFFALLVFILPFQLLAQHSISLKVTDKENKKALEGVNIIIENTQEGGITDINGELTLKNVSENSEIKISCLGYESKTVKASSPEILIELSKESIQLDEFTINATYTRPVKRAAEELYTGTEITSKGLEKLGIPAKSSVYNSINILPGIDVESQDAYGLSDKVMRLRGVRNYFGGLTIEGFPNYGIMPIGARDNIYDTENIDGIAVYKGATPADLGTATGNKGGALELIIKRPKEEFSVELDQTVGSSSFMRSFVRSDFGIPQTGTNAFVSYSYTLADKWKGEGKLGPRHNSMMGITQNIGEDFTLEIFTNYNNINRNSFRKLNYENAENIKEDYDITYNTELTGNPSEDVNYFDYNTGEFINKDIFGIVHYKLNEQIKTNLRMYYSGEDASYLETVQKGSNFLVFNRVRDIDRMGIIPEVSGKYRNLSYSAGYWFESCDNHASVYQKAIIPDGLKDLGYAYIVKKEKPGQIHSPYIKVSAKTGNFRFQAGLKAFNFHDAEGDIYQALSATELNSEPTEALHLDEINFFKLLPTAGVGYNITEKSQVYFNYGRNYMRPYMYSPIISLYIKNMDKFMSKGMTLQNIFDSWEMETSDNFDLGYRFSGKKISVNSSVFYAMHHDVLASVYNPEVNLDYYQNAGEMTSYGTDLEIYYYPVDEFSFFINPAYHKMSYNDDILRKDGATYSVIEVEGNQSPATPVFYFKAGGSYTWKGLSFAPMIRYTGERYGDATNIERVAPYTVIDANLSYTFKDISIFKDLAISCQLLNLTDEKYVGCIDVSDDSSNGSAVYYAGSPRTFLINVKALF